MTLSAFDNLVIWQFLNTNILKGLGSGVVEH